MAYADVYTARGGFVIASRDYLFSLLMSPCLARDAYPKIILIIAQFVTNSRLDDDNAQMSQEINICTVC